MKSTERQQQILECAKRIFAERGFHSANISHICNEAGIGRGTLYQYFENKKAVFTAIIDEVLERVHAAATQRRSIPLPNPADVSRAEVLSWSTYNLTKLLAVVFADEHTLRILLREAVGLDVDIEKRLTLLDDSIITAVEKEISAAQKVKLVRADLDPRMSATLMVGGIEKLALAALRNDDPIDVGKLAEQAVRLHHIGILSSELKPESSDQ